MAKVSKSGNASSSSQANSIEDKVKNWSYKHLHSPVGFDGRRPEDILKVDMKESQEIFSRELPKRKAAVAMKAFETKDGLELRYWFAQMPGNNKVKILVHGSGSNFAKAERAVNLLDRAYNVAMVSYRGHSGNPGQADQKTIIKDVKAAIEDVIQSGYKMEDVYLEGSSLGTCSIAHAMDRIYQNSGSAHQFAGLLLKAAPLNLNERDKDTLDSLKEHGLQYDRAEPFLKKLWNQEEVYGRIRAKEIKIVHGTKDDVVPFEHAEKIKVLLEKKNQNVELLPIEGEGHRLDLDQYGVY